MLNRILVPLDGSPVAESILPAVQAFARLTGAEVTLFQAIEPLEHLVQSPEPTTLVAAALRVVEPGADEEREEEPPRTIAKLEERANRRAHTYLISIAQQLQHQDVVVHTRIGQGPAADAIVAAASEYDLVAMATHGRGGVGRWVYGSVADKVLRGATVPVLLVRAGVESPTWSIPPRRLLAPLDGSELAERALPLVIALAKRAGAEVLLVQSVAWATVAMADPYGYGGGFGTAEVLDQAQADAQAYLDEVSQRLTGQGLTVHARVSLEQAADAILDLAEKQQADLIVMSTHGRGGLGRWVYGSVADRVLRGATVPILLVRASTPTPEMGAPEGGPAGW